MIKQAAWVITFVIVGILAGIGGQQVIRTWRQPAPVAFHDYRAFLTSFDSETVLFTTTTCPYCRAARESLTAQGVRYRELAIDESAVAKRAFENLGELGVPVLITPDRLIRGFQPEIYRDWLNAEPTRKNAG